MSNNGWLQMIENNPEHSQWYIDRFEKMAQEGRDLNGEARLIDAMVKRNSRILDAGCGPGRVGGQLALLGHDVLGVDLDSKLIDKAKSEYPGAKWLTQDLSELNLSPSDAPNEFDCIVSAGNVMTFLDPETRCEVIGNLAKYLAPGGRLVIGFGADRGYEFDDFFKDAKSVGLKEQLNLSTWDILPFEKTSMFLVAIFTLDLPASS
jgi:2-polyprenyl-3-methyl-5-hydroxy-6-metoxy-1,4-benzoquinol methylase